MQQEIRWGWVQQVYDVGDDEPALKVRIAGDDADITIRMVAAGYTPAVEEKVLLAKAGTKDGWVIVCKLEPTA
jgi:CYTH domain-containing protein